tara:strand:- start:208 stop:615 length:408 start_codon:yes stop_codon:yes gene_type:complete
MASTRNNNTSRNYKLEQKYHKDIIDNRLYIHSSYGEPYEVNMPSVGYIPSHMSRDSLAKNPVDIESRLYGIYSTNLIDNVNMVGNVDKFTPETDHNISTKNNPNIKKIKFIDFFDRTELLMPRPLQLLNNQRPFP